MKNRDFLNDPSNPFTIDSDLFGADAYKDLFNVIRAYYAANPEEHDAHFLSLPNSESSRACLELQEYSKLTEEFEARDRCIANSFHYLNGIVPFTKCSESLHEQWLNSLEEVCKFKVLRHAAELGFDTSHYFIPEA